MNKTPAAPAKPLVKPAVAKPMELTTIAGLTVAVWMPPDATPRPLPVILFSHGYRGCNIQSAFLMRALASKAMSCWRPTIATPPAASWRARADPRSDFPAPTPGPSIATRTAATT
ncbi:MAG: hypothetical protein WDO24_24685 [Pseudomonadota bacterium]